MTDPTDALAAALHAIGGFADDFPRPTAAEREDAVDLLAALAASGWTLAPVETEQANLAGFREGLAHAKATYGPGHRAAAIAESRRIGNGPTLGPLTPKQVRILDNRHHRVGNTVRCACGYDIWAFCEVHRLIETIDAAALAQPAPDPLGPDDHGHTGRLWCDPCVAHGVMLEQGVHRCAPTPDPLRCRHCPNTSHTTEWHEAHYSYPLEEPMTPEAEDNKAALESLPDAVQGADLNRPARVIVCQHGHYWRDYGEFWSMCPVSGDNLVCNPKAVYLLAPTPDPRHAALVEALEAELRKQRALPDLMRSSGYESGIEFARRAALASEEADRG